MKCGFCRAVCPIFTEFKIEPYSPRGRIQLTKNLILGITHFNPKWHDPIFRCLICKACVEECPSGVELDRIFITARHMEVIDKSLSWGKRIVFRYFMRARRVFPFTVILFGILQRISLIFWRYNPLRILFPLLGMPMGRSVPLFTLKPFLTRVPEVVPAKGERRLRVAFFVGCATNYLYPRIGSSLVKVLSDLGVEVVIPKGQMCCGTPLYISGDIEGARYLAQRNIEIFSQLDVDYIVTGCASCGLSLKKEWNRLMGLEWAEGKKVRDISELLKELGLPNELVELGKKVTYHDPCHLRRGQGIWEEPRELLKQVIGDDFVEMRDSDRCCGGAGSFNLFYYDTSRAVGKHKRDRVLESGAEMVATNCPSCIMQLRDILPKKVKVLHTVEIIEKALRKANKKK
ncbi:(Fe-S)-binding protein [bacterium]|nr:(Fe-S)-binding protein [bacterium]